MHAPDKKSKKEDNRSCEMVTDLQEIDGFSRTLGVVKELKKKCYNSWQLTQLQRKFPHVTSHANEIDIVIGI